MADIGILLINLGTPSAADKAHVRAYLREFLNDPRVIDLPWALRQCLLYGLILPFRTPKTAHAYQQIWQPEGSPLLIHNQQLAQSLARELGENYQVALGMRYGQPSIRTALQELKNCQKLLVLPLFPQYSSAATGSALAKLFEELQRMTDIPEIKVINSFYEHPDFIEAWKAVIKENWPAEKPEMWLFSYHSLPLRHLTKRGCDPEACSQSGNCASPIPQNQQCYRRQCLKTTQLLAQALGLQPKEYCFSFQSRLGRTPWLTPYTDHLLTELASQGVKRLAVVCPSFVTDCLETLEEIGIRGQAQWEKQTGYQFTLLPCLNHHKAWTNALAQIVAIHTA